MRSFAIGMAAFGGFLGSFAGLLQAQGSAPIGLWKNEEPDKTVLIRTYEQNGKLYGKVEKLIKGGKEDADAKCTKCQGDTKDKPVKGLLIIWDLEKDGNRWSGGKIMDPEDGKVYKCRVTPADNGQKLEVRGSFAVFSKTQTWTRLE